MPDFAENIIIRLCGHEEVVRTKRANGDEDYYQRFIPELKQEFKKPCDQCKKENIHVQ